MGGRERERRRIRKWATRDEWPRERERGEREREQGQTAMEKERGGRWRRAVTGGDETMNGEGRRSDLH